MSFNEEAQTVRGNGSSPFSLISLVAIAAALCQPATAAECDKITETGTMAELRECLAQQSAVDEAALTKAYKEILAALDAEEKKVLVEAQRAWITWREKEIHACARAAGFAPVGSAYGIQLGHCRASINMRRAEELKRYMAMLHDRTATSSPIAVPKPATIEQRIQLGTSAERRTLCAPVLIKAAGPLEMAYRIKTRSGDAQARETGSAAFQTGYRGLYFEKIAKKHDRKAYEEAWALSAESAGTDAEHTEMLRRAAVLCAEHYNALHKAGKIDSVIENQAVEDMRKRMK